MAIKTFYNNENNEPESPINGKKIFKTFFFLQKKINTENLPIVKSVDIRPLFKKTKYQLKNCKTNINISKYQERCCLIIGQKNAA